GMLKGGILVLFSQDSASLLVDILMRRPPSSTKLFTISDISAIAESSHILSSSYLSAVGEFLGIYQIIPSIPQTIMDRMDRIASILIKNYVGENINYIIPIENQLNIDGVLVKMYVIFVLERESVNKILKIMKMAGI
ncbi:MAG: hypothetical protein KKE64_01125, partial [Candidatus Omnitrophica bacterium]|nr:hypothetical protein [Candidatus Omnitrophota bacterium]